MKRKFITRKCVVCGKEFQTTLSRVKHGRGKACSRECGYKTKRPKKNNAVRELICPVCGKKFTKTINQIKRAKVSVCSPKCLYKGRSKGIIKTGSRKNAKISTKGRKRMSEAGKKTVYIMLEKRPKATHITRICEACGKEFDIREKELGHRSARFCSLKCTGIAQTGKNNPVWRGGIKPYRGHGWKRIRKEILERDNHTCQECNKTKEDLGKEPDVHHIVPFRFFKDECEANDPDNLISLCNRCHGKMEFNDNESKQILQSRSSKGYAEI